MHSEMLDKKRLVLIILVCVLITTNFIQVAQAGLRFKRFDFRDYQQGTINQQEKINQIRTFAVWVEKAIERCKKNESGEQAGQNTFCTNIYEADRIRLALLLALNANVNPDTAKKSNEIRRIIYKINWDKQENSNKDTPNAPWIGGGAGSSESNGDADSIQFDYSFITDFLYVMNYSTNKIDPSKAPFSTSYNMTGAVHKGLESCITGTDSATKRRLKQLNPNIKVSDESLEQAKKTAEDADKKIKDHETKIEDLTEKIKQTDNQDEKNKLQKELDELKKQKKDYEKVKKKSNNDAKTAEKELKKPQAIGCEDILATVRQFTKIENVKLFLDNNQYTPWLEYTKDEWETVKLSDEAIKEAESRKLNDEDYADTKSNCFLRGLQAIAICPPMRFLGATTQGGMSLLEKKLMINPRFFSARARNGQITLFRVWQEFCNFANLLLLIAFILMVIFQITSYKLDTFHARKFLPKLAAIAILVNLSYLICQFAIDISNITGIALFSFFRDLLSSKFDITTIVTYVLNGTFLGVAGSIIGIILLIPAIITVALTILVTMVMLSVKDAIAILMVFLTPLALASLLLPNSSRLFQIWKKAFWAVLIIPSMVGMMFGAGLFVSRLMYSVGGIMSILSLIPLGANFFLLPILVTNMLSNLPIIGGKISSTLSSLPNNLSDKYKNSNFHKDNLNYRSVMRNRQRIADSHATFRRNPLAVIRHSLRQGSARVGNIFVPGMRDLAATPDFNPEVHNEIKNNAKNMDPAVVQHYLHGITGANMGRLNNLSTSQAAELNTMQGNNDPKQLLSAILVASDDGSGDAMMIDQALREYARRGGDSTYATQVVEEVITNYRKEGNFGNAALIREHLLNSGNVIDAANGIATTSLPQADQVRIMRNYIENLNAVNWKKFNNTERQAGRITVQPNRLLEEQAIREIANTPIGNQNLRTALREMQSADARSHLQTIINQP